MKSFKSAVIDNIKLLAAQRPDNVAECRYYTKPGEPCCIVGNVMHLNGAVRVEDEDGEPYREYVLSGPEIQNVAGLHVVFEGKSSAVIDWTALGVEDPTIAEEDWVRAVQSLQDKGATWALAVENAGPAPVLVEDPRVDVIKAGV